MQFGIQNSVIAWDDPWHRESCKTMMRTGRGSMVSLAGSASRINGSSSRLSRNIWASISMSIT